VIDFWTAVAAEARDLAPLEVVAVAAAIAYLVLAIRQSIWCWLGAGISTAIYVYLFFVAKLYMESALNLFYFAMAIGAEPFLFRNGHLRLVRMVFRAVR
jgi:nicotinamide mononucleotide transporter